MKLIDTNHPFFRPAWRRWATFLVPAVWAVFEAVSGEPFWAILFGALAAYAGWVLIVTWKEPES